MSTVMQCEAHSIVGKGITAEEKRFALGAALGRVRICRVLSPWWSAVPR